jgi:hypothetical protein
MFRKIINCTNVGDLNMLARIKKVKQSRYMPWRRLGGEEV